MVCKSSLLVAAGLAVVVSAVSSARAAIVLTVSQVGPDVVISGSGSLNITGITPLFNSGWVLPSGSRDSARVGAGTALAFGSLSGPATMGTGGAGGQFASSTTGVPFGITTFNSRYFVPQDYVSGESLSGTATYNGVTLASLGFAEGTYVYTIPVTGDTITVIVPAPGAAAMLGVGGLVAMRRRRGT